MKDQFSFKAIAVALFAGLISIFLSTFGTGYQILPNQKVYIDQTTKLEPVLKEVKRQYDIASKYIDNRIHITEADAIFDVVNTTAIDGNLSIWIAKADSKGTIAGETTIAFSLLDTFKEDNPKPQPLDTISAKETLARLIFHTTREFLRMQTLTIGSSKPQIFKVDVNYSVENDGSIELSPKIGNLDANGIYDRDTKVTQTVTLKYELRSPKKIENNRNN